MPQPHVVREQDFPELGSKLINSSPSELNDLLELAERIQASYENASRREILLRLIEAVLLIGGVALLITGIDSGRSLSLSIGIGVGLLAYLVAIDALLLQRARRHTQRDRYALAQVLDLLRDLEEIAAIDEDWTPLQRAEYRIRLSRFEIEDSQPLLSGLLRLR